MPRSNPERSRDHQLPVSDNSPKELYGEQQAPALRLTVLFTTVADTLEALRKAASLAFQLDACIQILVVQVVPYPLPIDNPRVTPAFRLRHFHLLCEQEHIETSIDVRLCRDAGQCIQDTLPTHSVVLVGGRKSWWPFTGKERLVRSIKRGGHHVIRTSAPSKRTPCS